MAGFEPRRITGIWFRHVPGGKAPLGRPPVAADGRWQRGEVVEGLYLADSEATALAEWYRWLAEAQIPPRATLPRDLWRFDLDVEVADLSTEDRLRPWGLPMPLPDSRGWSDFQDVGERAHHEAWAGLIAPSAARRGGLVACLFRSAPAMSGVRPVPPPDRLADAPPPPRGLVT